MASKTVKGKLVAEKEHGIQKLWRPSVAIIYLVTVLFDFIIMPVYVESTNKVTIDYALLDRIDKLENSELQVELARKMDVTKRTWDPLTLMGSGLFHLAFGSILTGAAITRGLEKRDRAGYNVFEEEDTDAYYTSAASAASTSADPAKGKLE